MASVKKYIRQLKDRGVSESDFEKEREVLSKRFNKPADDNDVIWSLYNKLVTRTNDLQDLSSLYYDMALFLNTEGKDYIKVLQTSHEMMLRFWQSMGVVKGVSILAQGCEECQKLNGKKFLISEAMAKKPIPNLKCTHTFTKKGKPFCRCMYLQETEDI